MNCKNCGAHLDCSCKLRKASDGKECCSLCVQAYEMNKGKGNPSPNNFQGSPPPTINNGGSITPKIVSITFNNVND